MKKIKTRTPGPWLKVRQDDEHVLISNATDRTWCLPEHYIGKVRANNANLIIGAPGLFDVLQEIRAGYASTNEHGAIEIVITPELRTRIETALALASDVAGE